MVREGYVVLELADRYVGFAHAIPVNCVTMISLERAKNWYLLGAGLAVGVVAGLLAFLKEFGWAIGLGAVAALLVGAFVFARRDVVRVKSRDDWVEVNVAGDGREFFEDVLGDVRRQAHELQGVISGR